MEWEDEKTKGMEAKIETLEADLVAMKGKIDGLRMLIWLNIALSVVFGVVKLFMAGHAPPASASGNSVQIGAAMSDAAAELTRRDYLRTDEVAKREGVSPRTVISMVERGDFSPAPVKDGREWRFSKGYTLGRKVANE